MHERRWHQSSFNINFLYSFHDFLWRRHATFCSLIFWYPTQNCSGVWRPYSWVGQSARSTCTVHCYDAGTTPGVTSRNCTIENGKCSSEHHKKNCSGQYIKRNRPNTGKLSELAEVGQKGSVCSNLCVLHLDLQDGPSILHHYYSLGEATQELVRKFWSTSSSSL